MTFKSDGHKLHTKSRLSLLDALFKMKEQALLLAEHECVGHKCGNQGLIRGLREGDLFSLNMFCCKLCFKN